MIANQRRRRMILVAPIVLGVFLAITLLWSSGGHVGAHDGPCLPASLQGDMCSREADLASLSSHAGAFTRFVQSLPGSPATLLLTLLVSVVFGFMVAAVRGLPAFPIPAFSRAALRHWRVPRQLTLSHWLALHESSPCLAF